MKGILLTMKGAMSVKDYGEPLYQTTGADVDGYIEVVHPVRLPEPYVMICNEEGILIGLDVNPVASTLYGAQIHGQMIRGNVVLMQVGMTDEGPDVIGLEDSDVRILQSILVNAGAWEEKKQ